jgi:hypothetical protein
MLSLAARAYQTTAFAGSKQAVPELSWLFRAQRQRLWMQQAEARMAGTICCEFDGVKGAVVALSYELESARVFEELECGSTPKSPRRSQSLQCRCPNMFGQLAADPRVRSRAICARALIFEVRRLGIRWHARC